MPPRPASSLPPQVRRVDRTSRSKFLHIIHIRQRDEVEPPITDWLREAYKFSKGRASKAARKSRTHKA